MTVRRLLAETDSHELSEWMAYERVAGPLGGVRGDAQAAVVSATIANVNRSKGQRPTKVSEFLIEWDQRPQTWQEQLAIAKRINKAHGGTVQGGDDGDNR